MNEHASFFSGVGGLDLGLERAGWRTVSFSEIDPYASTVLAERWPGVPNLGDITVLHERARMVERGSGHLASRRRRDGANGASSDVWAGGWPYAYATLWTGGFPCQDLSVAGKRRGMVEGSRSNLAHAFLDLVERHRPPAVLLENVPGLLSSHRGRDMAALTGRLAELGYGVAYRVLDARHFGVPQRRRRVFILGLRSDPDDPTGRVAAERAAAVLAVGSRCPRHPATGGEAGPDAAAGAQPGVDIVGTVPAGLGHHGNGGHSSQAVAAGHLISPEAYARRDGAPDGLAGRLDDRLMGSLREHVRPGSNTDYTVIQSLDTKRGGPDDNEAQAGHLIAFDPTAGRDMRAYGDGTTPGLKIGTGLDIGWAPAIAGNTGPSGMTDDPLLPLGLDSHRYRCCGNGVVAPVSEWIGRALLQEIESRAA